MPSEEEIKDQQELLTAHRRSLFELLRQRALITAPFVPPAIATGIQDARNQIRQLKKNLRDWGVTIDDHPNDEESSSSPPEPFGEVQRGRGDTTRSSYIVWYIGALVLLAFMVIASLALFFIARNSTQTISATATAAISLAELPTAIPPTTVPTAIPPTTMPSTAVSIVAPTVIPTTITVPTLTPLPSQPTQSAAQATVESFSKTGQMRREVASQSILYDKEYGWKHIPTQVSAKDFSISARMYVPRVPNHVWSYGFAFGEGCKFLIGNTGKWALQCDNVIAEGVYDDISAETYNDLSLTILNSKAFIFVNNKHIATENIPVDGATVNEIFIGWQLSERAAPLSSSVSVYFENLQVIVKNP
jgi:hypothetical protein